MRRVLASARKSRFTPGVKITLDLPASLAARISTQRAEAVRVVAAGLRRKDSVLESELARLTRKLSQPLSAREVLALRLSGVAQRRVDDLLAKHHANGLSRAERKEWRLFEMAEHLVVMAKLKAAEEAGVPRHT